ncbi:MULTISPECIES: transcriptional regulator GutM [Vibrio]|uniref:Transcriptional regulator n=1 Tax=Vibrio diabolicus TaxID=50719 RepID=A0AAX1XTL0_9VIBR|nr:MULTISPECIES: transcriptional regulator GutM [Vibrio]HCG8768508.1 transcriptional regulator GutM [Vibrio parahaemolyticus]MCS0347162.1 transcriptional regulator GutM [Vibrio diabolicus]MCS0359266.1 transcriptional regulator GutM [Vibrio diabolicus]MCS0373817.1 transcriptional regulator GutM [Vibrio diabolicus]MCS0428897.1 transcriptional regulator GutM [Vibrio diabolicus]
MDSISLFISIAIVAWVAQIAMSFFQIRAFNRMIQSMASKGKVKIGRTKSRWKARTIVVIVESEQGIITDAKVLNGVTVFARPKTLTEVVGSSYPLDKHILNKLSNGIQEALNVAFQTE